MSVYRDLVRGAVEAVAFSSPSSLTWFGEPSPKLPRATVRAASPADLKRHQVITLQSRLYGDFYCAGGARAAEDDEERTPFGDVDLVEELSDSNHGAGSWEQGWTIVARAGDEVVVQRDGLKLRASWPQLKPHDEHLLGPDRFCVHFPKELCGASPGFYMALSDRPLDPDSPLIRLYWNLTPVGAVQFMDRMTGALNADGFGFKLKIVNARTQFERCDNTVLYICRHDFARLTAFLQDIHREFREEIVESVPALTKALAAGVGVAEDPPASESYGMHRCRLIAEALVRASDLDIRDDGERLYAVEERFRQEGLSIDAPYLNPGSDDTYAWPSSSAAVLSRRRVTRRRAVPPGSFLETALTIGRYLAAEALWHDQRCTWMGVQPLVAADGRRTSRTLYASLGPDVYGGVAGVALFLAELSALTGDRVVQRTAVAAARQAAYSANAVPTENRLGLYTGWTGIALALARIGLVTAADYLVDIGEKLAAQTVRAARGVCEHDYLGGRAGAIVGLIALDAMLDRRVEQRFIVSLGEELLNEAQRGNDGMCSWKSPLLPTKRNLTGLSHGAAGIALGLLELHRVTADERLRDCALRAFSYERSVFVAEEENWPDFRDDANQPDANRSRNCAVFWCHGAPGIAVSRIRASRTLEGEIIKREALLGLNTTRRALRTSLAKGGGNYSLCHGDAGNGDVLLHGLAEGFSGHDDELPYEVGEFGISRYLEGQSWPGGLGSGRNPSLMLGLAGTGYFYLRLHSPATPSVLTLLDYADHLKRPDKSPPQRKGDLAPTRRPGLPLHSLTP